MPSQGNFKNANRNYLYVDFRKQKICVMCSLNEKKDPLQVNNVNGS